MSRRFHQLFQWWLSVTMPTHIQATTIAAREHLRKAQLFSIIGFFNYVFSIMLFLEFVTSRNVLMWSSIAFIGLLLFSGWLNKRGALVSATFTYLIGYNTIIGMALAIKVQSSPFAFFWEWVLLLLSPMLASIFLPYWTPFIFAIMDFAMVLSLFFLKQANGEYGQLLSLAAQIDFVLFSSIGIFAIAIVSSVHAYGVAKALRESDRAAELEQARDALAVANARLEDLAIRDAVTGLLNQRALHVRLPIAVADAERAGTPLAVIFADLDHFKQVNDTWGHKVGDLALAHLATCLRDNVRAADIVARYGGEEFVVVLPEHNQIDAVQMAERLRAIVAAAPVILPDGQKIAITLSLGVAIFPDDGRTITDILNAADAAMYCAKRAGRNRVSVAAQIDTSAAA